MDSTLRAQQEVINVPSPWKFNFWEAPEDPDRPLLPYLPGFSVQVFRHARELEDLGLEQRPRLSEDYLRTVTHSEAVVANLNVEEIRGPSSETETAELVITSPIAIGSARGAQVVACTVTPQDGRPFAAAAKIYDPLYYKFEESMGHFPLNCVHEADRDFLVESWAYENLKKAGQTGSFAPEYYGSWKFTLPIVIKGKPITRPVRLILIERLNGTSIQGLRVQNSYNRGLGTDAFHFPEEYRLEVLARAMDGYVRQMNIGVEQCDFAGRNIILVPNEDPATQSERICGLELPRVILIDYNNASVESRSSDELDSRPINPALIFRRQYLWDDVAGWVPDSWAGDKTQEDWLWRRFCGNGQRELYRPVPEGMEGEMKQKDSGPQRYDSDHESATGAKSSGNGKVESKTSPSRPDGSDDRIQAEAPPPVSREPGCELRYPEDHSGKMEITNGSLFG